MAYYSPYHGSSTPGDDYYTARDRFQSATPTPSPRPHAYSGYAYGYSTPQRPSTRAHFRHASSGHQDYQARPPEGSPRFTSDGQYATANVSSGHYTRKVFYSTSRPKHRRRSSYAYGRSSTPHGDTDEDEVIEVEDGTFFIPADPRTSWERRHHEPYYYFDAARGRPADPKSYPQGAFSYYDRGVNYQSREPRPRPAANMHARRCSTSTPQRPATTRPTSSSAKKPPTPSRPLATEEDAERHAIPSGYSLKNWDPNEEPILLLGSVFDANSLGKWIYDWTAYHHGRGAPMTEVAGELWLLLIQFSGKLKLANNTVGRIRSEQKRELVEDFIESGDRLSMKLQKLLRSSEKPMLKVSAQEKRAQLGSNAGVEFVETLFGRDRELDRTESFMQSVRLFNMRFDANCDEILRRPTR